jgi:hypothetical protein
MVLGAAEHTKNLPKPVSICPSKRHPLVRRRLSEKTRSSISTGAAYLQKRVF